jgi:hypothetical protein
VLVVNEEEKNEKERLLIYVVNPCTGMQGNEVLG